ncbi:SCO4848 family membrane protein [Leifsonia sp. A12D58]|uniref:SCO4848 family membrane protein n=1 Tax=Leifsonia sp. A12D58 TaxID=3397674 RepID=UPI0039E045E1
MTLAIALILFLNAVFNVVAWPRFYTRVANDPRARDDAGRPTTFLTVHRVLVGIALALAAASAIAGVVVLVS